MAVLQSLAGAVLVAACTCLFYFLLAMGVVSVHVGPSLYQHIKHHFVKHEKNVNKSKDVGKNVCLSKLF